jgi:hypothetical protein
VIGSQKSIIGFFSFKKFHNLKMDQTYTIMKAFSGFSVSTLFFTLILAANSFSDAVAQQYVKSDFRVSDATGYLYEAVRLSVNKSGDMAAVWETAGSGDIWLKTISSKGEVLSSQISVDAPYSTMEPRIAHNGIGNFMVIFGAYFGSWSVMGQTYTPAADPIGDTLLVDRNTTGMIDMFKSSLWSNRFDQFGAFLAGNDSMIVEMFSESGEYLSNTIILKPDAQNFQAMYGQMTYYGNLLLVWLDASDGNFWGRIFSGDGTPQGDPFQISQRDPDSSVGDATLCSDSSGNFAVVWKNTMGTRVDIYSQLFSKEGVAVGENTKVTDDQANYLGYYRSLDMDLDGNFVIAWPDYRDNDTSFIYMQQMNELGAPVGHNYRATTINNGGPDLFTHLPSQVHPSVRILRDTIYLAWVNLNENVSNTSDIYASIQEWKVPDYTGLGQSEENPGAFSIYPNPSNGNFYLKWGNHLEGFAELTIFTSSGMLIHRENLRLTGQELQLHLPDIQEGVYFLKLDGESIHSSIPLIIK